MKFSNLTASRIELTELNLDGLVDFFEYSKKPSLYKYFEFEPQETIDESRKYLKKLIQRAESENAHYWYIKLTESKKVIGTFGVHDIDWRKKSAEISYGISPDYQRKGYFAEILRIVLGYLFLDCEFHRVFATTRFDNVPSVRGLEGIGMVKEGTLRDYYLSFDNSRHDAVVLSILKPEYIKTMNRSNK
jgi:[ribosomal protein S5]-alanine N-acetyltransferase